MKTKDKSPSSVIQSTKYHSAQKALRVEFIGGARYLYLGVPKKVWKGFLEAQSKGQYYNAEIKAQYVCYRVSERTN